MLVGDMALRSSNCKKNGKWCKEQTKKKPKHHILNFVTLAIVHTFKCTKCLEKAESFKFTRRLIDLSIAHSGGIAADKFRKNNKSVQEPARKAKTSNLDI